MARYRRIGKQVHYGARRQRAMSKARRFMRR